MEKRLIIHHTSRIDNGNNHEVTKVFTSDDMNEPKFNFERTVPAGLMSRLDAAVDSLIYAEAVSARFGINEISAFSNVPQAAQAAFNGGRG